MTILLQQTTVEEQDPSSSSSSSSIIGESSEFSIIYDIFLQQDDGLRILNCLEYLDVVTLIQKKSINKEWQQLCTKAIDNKCNEKKKSFESNQELRAAVWKYSPGNYWNNNNRLGTPKGVEDIATTYGYPINKWDVSNIKDFSYTFSEKYHFNEPIGSWDVSNATKMYDMFGDASSFNQDLSSWDVSNVTDMSYMFANARSFNQDISNWDVSNIANTDGMFYDCPFDAEQMSWFRSDMRFW